MDLLTLQDTISSNLPIYLGIHKVEIIDIFPDFKLAEIKFKKYNYIVDIMLLSENPKEKESSININWFI